MPPLVARSRARRVCARILVLAGLLPASRAGAQAPAPAAPRRAEAISDPVRLAPAEVVYVHPLYRRLDEPPRLSERMPPGDFEARATLVLTLHVNETGKVVEGAAVEPPLRGLTIPVAAMLQRWKFTPARKGGQSVATWATQALDLNVELEKPIYTVFNLRPLGKDDPLPAVARESTAEEWLAKYPKEIAPPDPAAVSVEDVDTPPVAEKTPWSFDATRQRARLTALVEVSALGAVSRILPTGDAEPLLVRWLRESAAKWKLAPAKAGGRTVASWMSLDATLDYTIDTAKKKGEKSVRKNLRATPPS